jgi:hypothetical protein
MAQEPHGVGSRVSVTRTRHGWYDGDLAATVIRRWQRETGTWCYMVRDDDGCEHEVNHTRDMRTISG